jgi:SAM-dependent methyltransferase
MADYYNKPDAEYLAAWQAMVPPARPSKEMLSLYESSMLNLNLDKMGEWALMGCTPELRSLAGKYQRPLTCIDINSNSYTALTPLCDPPEKEQFVQGDWLETDMPEAFDLILGDGPMVMLPQEQYPELIDSMYRLLKPGGYVITRILSDDDQMYASAKEALDWYRDNYKGKEPLACMLTDLWLICMDREAMAITKTDYVQWLNELYQDKIITQDEYKELDSPIMNVDLHCTNRQYLERLLGDKFEILSIEKPTDFVGGCYYPLYTLRKK